MNCPGSQRFFRNVPVGSTVEVELRGQPGDAAAVIDVFGPDQDDGAIGSGGTWTSNPLDNGGIAYLVRVLVTHNRPAQTTVSVIIRIRKPGGTIHSSPITCSSTGRAGDPEDFGLWPVLMA